MPYSGPPPQGFGIRKTEAYCDNLSAPGGTIVLFCPPQNNLFIIDTTEIEQKK
jgi:hypothetical protein